MDRKVFEKVISLNFKMEFIDDLLCRFETMDKTGRIVEVVFTNDRSMKPIVDEFREGLRCLLADYEREIEEL